MLIAIEGTDGSGKATQTKALTCALENLGHQVKKLSFPCYDSPSSALVKMYLGGEFGAHADDVNPYAASTFYAVDRFASYRSDWREFHENGGLVVTDRYTISNAIHQGAKLEGQAKKDYLSWLYHFEYELMGIPKPDLVIFLDVPADIAAALRKERETATNTSADIHEQDVAYLDRCRTSSLSIAEESGWVVVNCTANGRMRRLEDIGEEILGIALNAYG